MKPGSNDSTDDINILIPSIPSLSDRIVESALELAERVGPAAVTTRAVAEAAGVQAPALYRLFKDKEGLIDAVLVRGYERYMHEKREREQSADAVADLRAGFDLHVRFGLENPGLFALMYAGPKRASPSAASQRAFEHLRNLVGRIAKAGRLTVTIDEAVEMIHAAGTGVVFALLEKQPADRTMTAAERTREAVISAIVNDRPAVIDRGLAAAANALLVELGDAPALSGNERRLLREWLYRLAADARRTDSVAVAPTHTDA